MNTAAITIIVMLALFSLLSIGLSVYLVFIIEDLRIENSKLRIDLLNK